MNKLTILFLLFFFSFGCKKSIEEVQQNIVLEAMTNGQWKVTRYQMGTMDHTSDFAAHTFQFRNNNTVEALKNNNLEKTGSWNADPNARTISSSFTSAPDPLPLLNGTWNITKNSWTYVEATQTISGTQHTLRLDKQ